MAPLVGIESYYVLCGSASTENTYVRTSLCLSLSLYLSLSVSLALASLIDEDCDCVCESREASDRPLK